MAANTSHVKQLLATARIYRRPELLQEVLCEVREAEASTRRVSAEVRVLCAEVAVELKQWAAAVELLKDINGLQETRLLAVRRAFCEVLVALHHVDDNTSMSEEDRTHEYVAGAARALQALAEGVDAWPESLDATLTGIRTVWQITSPLLHAGHEAEVCDAVAFLATLHQQLRIGGGYTLVQWLVRAALCLRAAERPIDALNRFAAALEAAAGIGNQRLFLQVLRLSASVTYAKERATISSKTRTDLLSGYRNRAAQFAVLLCQLLQDGLIEMEACRDDLQNAYDALTEGSDAAQSAMETSTTASRSKKKASAVKPPATTRIVDTFLITDPDVIDEVKSDVLFCISLHGALSPEQEDELEGMFGSSNRRVRSFAAFALTVRDARRSGLYELNARSDASSICASHKKEVHTLCDRLVSVLKNTNTIFDESERQHALRTGASLLWNLVLPFLQANTIAEVQPALALLADIAQASLPALRELFLQVGTQQYQAAFDEDNQHVLHHLRPLLLRECEHGKESETTHMCSFRLHWIQHQIDTRDEIESSLTNAHDRCLYTLEQARWMSNPLKRIPLLKTAFRHLPPILSGDEDNDDQCGESRAMENSEAPRVRRSVVQLYCELLDLCMQDLSSSLYAVAAAVADALRTLSCSSSTPEDTFIEEVRAAASLHAATVLARQLEEAGIGGVPGEPSRSKSVIARTVKTDDPDEGRLLNLLKETADRGVDLERRRSGSGGWLVANACVIFLNWKQAAYAAGDYRTHLPQLLDMQRCYVTLFSHGHAQDVKLLSDLSTASILGLIGEHLINIRAAAGVTTPPSLVGQHMSGFAALVQEIRNCFTPDSANPQLKRAQALYVEVSSLIVSVRQKWFLVILSPTLARLVNDKPMPSSLPQEQLLMLLGTLAGPSTAHEKRALLLRDARPLLQKDPCVRLCAWVALVAADLDQEEMVLECCELADRLYTANQLGWGSSYETPSSSAVSGRGAEGLMNNRGSASPMHVHQDLQHSFPRPDEEDWEAYAQLLFLKAQVGMNHLQGLNGEARSHAVQLLLTNCVNSAIAAVQGPAAAKVEHISNAFCLYYTLLRSTRTSLESATFVLPSLRMLLSRALLTQLPRRSWSDSFTDVVYQLSCVLLHVSFSVVQECDMREMTQTLRSLRELLPPRCHKPLKIREITEVCYQNPSVSDFLQMSKNMEAELQARGWMIVAHVSKEVSDTTEAFALALAGSKGSPLAMAQCLFEYAYTKIKKRGIPASFSHVTRQLHDALRVLEGIPDAKPIFQLSTESNLRTSTLSARSISAAFVQSQRDLLLRNTSPTEGVTVVQTKRSTTLNGGKKTSNTTKVKGLSFQHLFLALRVLSLLFIISPWTSSKELPNHQCSLGKASEHQTLPSRRDYGLMMVHYVSCLWHLCAKWLRGSVDSACTVAMELPISDAHFYAYSEPAAAAPQLRRCVPDEEFLLNGEGLWQCLLNLGDYLVYTGDEQHAFMVYSWVRFAATLAFGGGGVDVRCSIVQRLCNWKMCFAAAACGLSDSPYLTALAQIDDAKVLVEELMRRDADGDRSGPAWEAEMILEECEIRLEFGDTQQAAALAEDVLARAAESPSWGTSALKATALRISARHAAICSRRQDALRALQLALDLVGDDALTKRSITSIRVWIEVCADRLSLLMTSYSHTAAVEWAQRVRLRLGQWSATISRCLSSSIDAVHTACMRAELDQATERWVLRLVMIMTQQLHPPGIFPIPSAQSTAAQHQSARIALLREVLELTENSGTLHSRLYRMYAQWSVRERVTSSWMAENDAKVDAVRDRLLLLLSELKTLKELAQFLHSLHTVRSSETVAAPRPPVAETPATSLSFWEGAVLYWTAVDRLEASDLAAELLCAFRRLTMAELHLPTSNAPQRCEEQVLRFIRGATPEHLPVATAADTETGSVVAPVHTVSERWNGDAVADTEEMEQALTYYGVADPSAKLSLDVSVVPVLLQKAATRISEWPNTHLASALLLATTQLEVRRRLEERLERSDELVGMNLQKQTQALLTQAWQHARLIPPKTEKPGSRTRRSLAATKRRSFDQTPPSPPQPLTEEEQMLLQRLSLGIQVAAQHGYLEIAAQLSGELGNLAVLLEIPNYAGAAAEQAQANQLLECLWRQCVEGMVDCGEGRLWRQKKAVPLLLTNSTLYLRLVELAMAATPMERALRSCMTLCVNPEKEGVDEVPSTPSKTTHITDVSPFVIDSAILSVAMDRSLPGACLVALRHPDGAVEGRRRCIPSSTWTSLEEKLNSLEAAKREQLGVLADARTGSAAERVTSEDASELLSALSPVAMELFGEFAPTLQQYCEKAPLYLSLPPELQAFPWEQTSVLSGSTAAVLRELSAAAVVAKITDPIRSIKRSSHQTSKGANSSSSKGSPSGPLLCFIDMFGDHRDSIVATCGGDHTKSKVPPQSLVTCTTSDVPPDAAYVTWMLRNSAPGSFVVNTCGSLTDFLPWSHLSSLTLTQVSYAILADGAVNASSQRREDRSCLTPLTEEQQNPASDRAPHPRWLAQVLLLLRGAKFVVANTFPCSPSVADGLARRCLSTPSSGKALVDQLRGKLKDVKAPHVTLYGVLASNTSKQK